MPAAAIIPLIAAGVQAAGDLIGTASTAQSTMDINTQNLQFQREKLQYDKQLQQTMFDREDSAVQRRRADLEAAGLSPVLAAGSGASAGPVVSTQAPQLGRVPDYGPAFKSAGRIGISALDMESAMLRNQQQAANVAATAAQTELVQQQAANAAIEGQYQTRSLEDRLDNVFQQAKQSETKTKTDILQNMLKKMETSAVLDLAARASGGNMELSREEQMLELDPKRADPRVWAEFDKAQAEARAAGIGVEFDQLMLDWEREYGRLLKGLGAAGGIAHGLLDSIRGMQAPRSTVIRVRGR